MNQESHWDTIAPNYNNEIFDVFKSDRNKKLKKYFKKHACKDHFAIDFGCGTGKAFHYMSPAFKEILAIDISGDCLNVAKSSPYTNIRFKRMDLTKKNPGLPAADFAFCCNVAILPELDQNRSLLKNIQKTLRKNGTALFVVPSLESVLFSSWILVDWYKREGVSAKKIPASELSYYNSHPTEVIQGIIKIDGVPTKHYSNPELQVLFQEAGLEITKIDKLEYDWSTEFSTTPKWLKSAPYPWDWLVECKKK